MGRISLTGLSGTLDTGRMASAYPDGIITHSTKWHLLQG